MMVDVNKRSPDGEENKAPGSWWPKKKANGIVAFQKANDLWPIKWSSSRCVSLVETLHLPREGKRVTRFSQIRLK